MFDKIILGSGIYGLYAALQCGKRGENVLVIEREEQAFTRATYINQARVHMGYHYPRSLSTALKSAHYFERFCNDYKDCILFEFDQIYATSKNFSYTNAMQFKKFCEVAEIDCMEVNPKHYFKNNQCDGAFITKEYTYDAKLLKDILLSQIDDLKNVTVRYSCTLDNIRLCSDRYIITINGGVDDRVEFSTKYILNATYASVNQILSKIEEPLFHLKYELCEIILCDVSSKLKNIGFTVMDGPFFSIMPFGKTEMHSLTAVSFTPHETSHEDLPNFDCMGKCESEYCNPFQLGNCNYCSAKPNSAWSYMSGLAHKYLLDIYDFKYKKSLFSMKPILKSAEVDDSRPTVIRVHTKNPTFVSVLSGKINTIYDLDEVLFYE